MRTQTEDDRGRRSRARRITASAFFTLDESAYDAELEADFFDTLKIRNGTFKKTQVSRFTDLEAAFGPIIAERAERLTEALDVGVSSGITTLEFADFLGRQGADVRLTATDLCIRAHIVDLKPSFRVLADPEGWPLQYDIHGISVRPWIRRLDYPTLTFLPRILARRILQPKLKAKIIGGQSRPVSLVSPRLMTRRNAELVENDIMERTERFAGQFDIVRAANLLNLSYFPKENLTRAIGNIRSYLSGPGALFLVTRTNLARENAGSLFELCEDRTFRVLSRIGGGSEVESLVVGVPSDV